MFEYKIASLDDLERLWDYHIRENPDDPRYIRWKAQFIADNTSGAAVTFLVTADGEPVGEGTLLLSPECRAIRGRTELCDGSTSANINALRIRNTYEGSGHISKLIALIEQYARSIGLSRLTIGVEACEARNLAIYLHWGYDQLVLWETEDDSLVLYYAKALKD